MNINTFNKPFNLVIFGARGNLVKKKIIPSLFNLFKLGYINPKTKIICTGRILWSKSKYINFIKKSFVSILKKKKNEDIFNYFCANIFFYKIDINEKNDFKILLKKKINFKLSTIYYCAVPPDKFEKICFGLALTKLNFPLSKIVIEKPFGNNLISSKKINKKISLYFKENQIYRIDHYLGKDSIINLLMLRMFNSRFVKVWNNKIIDHMQITVFEKIGIENRNKYFDKTGQIKDMLQSHILQIFSIITMSIPKKFTSETISEEKVKILKSLKPISVDSVEKNIIKGQYIKGKIDGNIVPGYLEEIKSKKSNTETFIAIKTELNHPNWKGIPFYIRTGKRLKKKYSEIVIHFKNSFVKNSSFLNKLIIKLHPINEIVIQISKILCKYKKIFKLENLRLKMNLNYYKKKINSYGKLFLEIIKNLKRFFIYEEEVYASWKWIDEILSSCKNNKLFYYKAGSWGPRKSFKMIKTDGNLWNKFD
ncbi:MAG: glucose-6-phosphate dehydrogenase [Enterobacteriaceae bacterium]